MKKLTLIITMVLGITMMSCVSKSQERQIISRYAIQNELFICYLDSSDIEIQVIAKDKYQAMKYFDSKLEESDINRNYQIKEFPIEFIQ